MMGGKIVLAFLGLLTAVVLLVAIMALTGALSVKMTVSAPGGTTALSNTWTAAIYAIVIGAVIIVVAAAIRFMGRVLRRWKFNRPPLP